MNILVTEPYSIPAIAQLQAAGHKIVEGKAEIALIRSRTRIDAHFLDQHPDLKLVVTATSGFDHIDWRETKKRGIVCAHTPEANAAAAAELTLGLLIAAERQLLPAHKNVRNGQWREHLKRPRGLEGHTLGVIGLGRIGLRVARLAALLDMRVIVYDPYIEDFHGFTRTGFIELLRESDYVTLHVPLTKETKHLLNQPTFGEMNSDALLINTCRGPVVDENDLMTALDDGTIAGAAMDVIEREPPPPGHRLLKHPKLLLTPHIGAFTDRAWERASLAAVQKALQFARGETLSDTLPLSTPWFDM
jgi:D-3-phosphoglycerate dehydrogenase